MQTLRGLSATQSGLVQGRLLPDAGLALAATHLDECVAEIRAAIAAASADSTL